VVDENRTQKYLDFEAALARVQARLGLIPQEAADEIVRHCRVEEIDLAKLREQTERIGYPVLGVVSQLNALCRDKLGEYCHWGATTQDITDTATVLQIRESLAIVGRELAAISAALAKLARAHRDTPMAGRSNLQQAIPVTFGYKMAGLLSAIERHRERLRQLEARVLVGEFAGAAGTLASLERAAMETQAGVCKELGLAQPLIAWHTIRDNIAEVGAFLGLVGGTLGKVSMDVKLLMQTEVGEVYEPFAHGRGSSSTMPQKRNPISSCYIHAAISVVRQHAAALMDAMVADHERSTGPWEIEWIVLPEAFCLMAGALRQTRFVLEGLEVDPAAMRRNLDITHGLVMSEAVMMGLGPHIGREYAHDLVYDICRVAVEKAPAAGGSARRASRDREAPRSRRARAPVRSGELPRPVGRDGGQGARDASMKAAAAAFAAVAALTIPRFAAAQEAPGETVAIPGAAFSSWSVDEVRGRFGRPAGATGKVPAVLILHGSGGVDGRGAYHAKALQGAGIATLEITMFPPGGRPRAGNRATMPHAVAALKWLAGRADVDAGRLGVMGFSWGGGMTVLMASELVQEQLGPDVPRPVAFAPFYPVCGGIARSLARPEHPFYGAEKRMGAAPMLIQRRHARRLRNGRAPLRRARRNVACGGARANDGPQSRGRNPQLRLAVRLAPILR
jgi:3-carboxy-cis,cis-muconate cycloisomerase